MTPAAGGSKFTVDEVGRRMEKIEEDFRHGLEGLHRRLDELRFVHPETFAMQLQLDQAHRDDVLRQVADLRGEILQIKDNSRWLWRTVVGALISAVVVGLLVLAGLPA